MSSRLPVCAYCRRSSSWGWPINHLALIETLLRHIEAKDLSASMAYFAENAEFHDPHYPQAHMRGQAAIRAGLHWGFARLKSFSFTILNVYTSGAGNTVAVEIRAAHVLPNGRPLNFPEVFLFEFEGDKIKTLRVFVPYGPHGMVGLALFVQRVIYSSTLLINKLRNQARKL